MDFNISQIDGINGIIFNNLKGDIINMAVGNFYCNGIESIAISAVNVTSNLGYLFIYQMGRNKYDSPINLNTNFQENSTYIYDTLPNLFGSSLAVSDINNDGCDDLIVGAKFSSPYNITNAGSVFNFYGSPTLKGVTSDAEILMDGKQGFRINGQSNNGLFGDVGRQAIYRQSDVNGDGLTDLAIGATGFLDMQSYENKVYLVAGTNEKNYPSVFNTSDISELGGSVFYLSSNNSDLGSSIVLGHFDYDGICDILIGNDESYNNSGPGQAFLYSGRANMPANIDLTQEVSNLTKINGVGSNQMSLGGSANNLGDLNNDGIEDFAIGVSENGCQLGARNLVFYSNENSSLPNLINYVDQSTNTPTPGFIIFSKGLCSDFFGISSVDFNNDGKKDIIKMLDYEHFLVVLFSLPSSGTITIEDVCSSNLCITYNKIVSPYQESIFGGVDLNDDNIDDFCFSFTPENSIYCLFGSPTWPNAPLPGTVAPTLEDIA